MTESVRLADQIRRAFEGNAWHGDSVLELLAGVDAKTAAAKPIKNAHSIWELLLHIAAWDDAVRRRSGGQAVELTDAQNFPSVNEVSEAAWRQAIESAKQLTMNSSKLSPPLPTHACRTRFRARPRSITTSFICSAASCSTSFTMRDRSPC